MLRDLTELVADWPPDLVVHDQAEYASAIVAGNLGIPHVTHGFGDVLPTVRVARTSDDVAGLWRGAGLAPRPYGGATTTCTSTSTRPVSRCRRATTSHTAS